MPQQADVSSEAAAGAAAAVAASTVPPEAQRARSVRLHALDRARAVAIVAMIVAHFGEGIFDRLGGLGRALDPVKYFSRLATPGFVLIFGITAGFVYLPKVLAGRGGEVAAGLRRRAMLLAALTLVIRVPKFIELGHGGAPLREWLFATYSILLYYAAAVAVMPWLLSLVARTRGRGLWAAPVLAVAIWAVGATLYAMAWGDTRTKSLGDFVRLYFFSGPYAFFQMTATAVAGVFIGHHARQSVRGPRPLRLAAALVAAGATLAAAGVLLGLAVSEYSVAGIVSREVKSPPRVWYVMHFGGFLLLALGAFAAVELSGRPLARAANRALYPVSLFGQEALVIFVSHFFVLPGIRLLRDQLGLPDKLAGVTMLGLFAAFCLGVMWRRHRILTAPTRAARPGPAAPDAAPATVAKATAGV